MGQSDRASVYTVARRAGVSTATVSRVIKNSPRVLPETRQRVLEAIEALGWRPNQTARALAGSAHEAVGIVFPDLSGPYYAEVIRGFEGVAVARNQAVMILATHGREGAERLVADLAGRVDGMVVMGRTVDDATVLSLLDRGVPLVLLARPPVGSAPAARSENRDSAVELANHLVQAGHRDLVFVGDPSRSPDVQDRFESMVAALRTAGVPPPSIVSAGGFDLEHGVTIGRRILTGSSLPEVLVCANDELACGVFQAAEEQGVHIPGGVAVTGWDDTPLAARLGLTTVRQPMRDLGKVAAELLFNRLDGRAVSDQTLPTQLVVRSSSGASETARSRT